MLTGCDKSVINSSIETWQRIREPPTYLCDQRYGSSSCVPGAERAEPELSVHSRLPPLPRPPPGIHSRFASHHDQKLLVLMSEQQLHSGAAMRWSLLGFSKISPRKQVIDTKIKICKVASELMDSEFRLKWSERHTHTCSFAGARIPIFRKSFRKLLFSMASSFVSDRGKSGTACENPAENEQIYQEAFLINQSATTPTTTLSKNLNKVYL